MKMSPRIPLTALLVCLSIVLAMAQKNPFDNNIKRIVFLGNSITYDGRYIAAIETYFLERYPDKKYEFINVGLPSETVSGLSETNHAGGRFPRPDLHERLARVLAQLKPDLVFANYGMNDGIYQPLANDRFTAFKNGLIWLHKELEKAGVKRIIHVTPPVHDDKKLRTAGYNKVLDAYADWLLSMRHKGWEVASLHKPMVRYLNKGINRDSTFKLANDGVHPGDLGHWLMAKAILKHLNQPVKGNLEQTIKSTPADSQVYEWVKKRQSIMKDAWLTQIGHKRPEMNKGMPLQEANKQYADIEVQIEQLLKREKE